MVKIFKITIRCKNTTIGQLADILDKKLSGFKAWYYQNSSYASFKTKSLKEISDLKMGLEGIHDVKVNPIKIEKVKRFWRI